MGPTTLFDKSFLQSLSLDESVWFDHFFLTSISPFFYVETLADLEKDTREGRTPEQEVRIISDKFPEMHGTPCMFHVNLALGNLAGHDVPMTWQIPIAGGRVVRGGGRTGVVYDKLPEAEAFARWQQAEFRDVERRFARVWRQSLSSLSAEQIGSGIAGLGSLTTSARTLREAKDAASSIVGDPARSSELVKVALLFLGASPSQEQQVFERWCGTRSEPLVSYAPYAAYVLTVELFYQIALGAGLISSARPSNRVDVAYLFYVPFCMVFVSSDSLHRKTAPLFMREDQEFVWGPDLKADLKKLNDYYSALPDETKKRGVMSFAGSPPKEGDFLAAALWDRHLPRWRDRPDEAPSMSPEARAKLVEELTQVTKGRELAMGEIDFDPRDPDALAIQRMVRKRKGTWWQLPSDLPLDDSK